LRCCIKREREGWTQSREKEKKNERLCHVIEYLALTSGRAVSNILEK